MIVSAQNMNGIYYLEIKFNVTFVDENDTNIYSKEHSNVLDYNVFYNCGEDRSFIYEVNDFFNGPNYELQQMLPPTNSLPSTCPQGSCFFTFTKKTILNRFESAYSKECNEMVFLPYVDSRGVSVAYKVVMVCIIKESGELRSYTICLRGSQMELNNVVRIPEAKILAFVLDPLERVLVLIT